MNKFSVWKSKHNAYRKTVILKSILIGCEYSLTHYTWEDNQIMEVLIKGNSKM